MAGLNLTTATTDVRQPLQLKVAKSVLDAELTCNNCSAFPEKEAYLKTPAWGPDPCAHEPSCSMDPTCVLPAICLLLDAFR